MKMVDVIKSYRLPNDWHIEIVKKNFLYVVRSTYSKIPDKSFSNLENAEEYLNAILLGVKLMTDKPIIKLDDDSVYLGGKNES